MHSGKAHLQRAELCLSPAIASTTEAVHCLSQYITLSGTLDDAAHKVLMQLLSQKIADHSEPEHRWRNLVEVLLDVEPQAGLLNAERNQDAVRRIKEHVGYAEIVQ